LSLPSHTDNKPRQFVLEPAGDDKYYVHMRIWDDVKNKIPASNVTNAEKQQLFDALYNELPEAAEILFPKSSPGNYGTRGTVAGLQRLARDTRFTPGTKGALQYLDKDGKTIKTYEGTSFIKAPRITDTNAANITPEQWTATQDAAIAKALNITPKEAASLTKKQFDAAVANGVDMAEAQRLKDLHFKVKSNTKAITEKGNPLKLYYTGEDNINTFNTQVSNKISFDDTYNLKWAEENGYELSPEQLARYENGEDVIVTKERPIFTTPSHYMSQSYLDEALGKNKTYAFYGNMQNPYVKNMNGKQLTTDPFEEIKESRLAGNDGMILENVRDYGPRDVVENPLSTDYVFNTSNQLKSANAVTFDDNDVRIPLGLRDNFNINDIRYGIAPFLLGGIGAGLYKEKK